MIRRKNIRLTIFYRYYQKEFLLGEEEDEEERYTHSVLALFLFQLEHTRPPNVCVQVHHMKTLDLTRVNKKKKN